MNNIKYIKINTYYDICYLNDSKKKYYWLNNKKTNKTIIKDNYIEFYNTNYKGKKIIITRKDPSVFGQINNIYLINKSKITLLYKNPRSHIQDYFIDRVIILFFNNKIIIFDILEIKELISLHINDIKDDFNIQIFSNDFASVNFDFFQKKIHFTLIYNFKINKFINYKQTIRKLFQ